MSSPRRRTQRRVLAATAAAVAMAIFSSSCAASYLSGARPGADRAKVRLDQVGYTPGETKHAYLMAAEPAAGASFVVRDAAGKEVLSGKVGAGTGGWNGAYRSVHTVDLSAIRTPGAYQVEVSG